MKYLVVLFTVIAILLLSYFVFKQVDEHFKSFDPKLTEIRERLRPVFPDIDEVVLLAGEKSYTINKQKIYLCLKDERGDYYNMNMLIYVTLHELAHTRCDEVDHTPKFYRIFDEMLQLATQHGLYNPSIPVIQNYCEY